jgi:hypothetical protein
MEVRVNEFKKRAAIAIALYKKRLEATGCANEKEWATCMELADYELHPEKLLNKQELSDGSATGEKGAENKGAIVGGNEDIHVTQGDKMGQETVWSDGCDCNKQRKEVTSI